MMAAEAHIVAWPELCGGLCDRFPHLKAIFPPNLHGASASQVLYLKVPYGIPLIKEGKFLWESLPEEFRGWQREYGDISVPLGVVLRRCVELYEVSPSDTPGMGHAVPLHLLMEGELFGLFQNFCDNFPQQRLHATAGGTSLIFLPTIGNQEALNSFANRRGWTTHWYGYHEHLKSTNGSNFYFGRFFKDILSQIPSAWRVEIALFPRSVVEQIKLDGAAYCAALEITLAQMRLSFERSEKEAEILGDDAVGNTGHVLALRMIHRGLRPGFYPVSGTNTDMNILPAHDLHGLFYGNEPHSAETTLPQANGFFPALFRPSLASEASFYFFNWPYVNPGKENKNVDQMVKFAVERAAVMDGPGVFQEVCASDAATAIGRIIGAMHERSVKLSDRPERNYFLRGGVALIDPSNGKAGAR